MRVLERHWDVEVVGGPEFTAWPPQRTGLNARARRAVRRLHSSLLLDRQELWSRRRFRNWSPTSELALLVGYPFSVLAEAGTRLRKLGIPYVLDVGDPWVLTAERPALREPVLTRARRVEEWVWRGAAGAIFTTRHQAERLRPYLRDKPVLVRPNGFSSDLEVAPATDAARPLPEGLLKLIHFGTLYGARIDVWPFISRIAEEGQWKSVEFHQFGPSWEARTPELPEAVKYVPHEPIPWERAVREAANYHAAVVVGSRDPSQLPSKVVSYLTLPMPRIAFVDEGEGNSITEYVADKPGWLIVDGKQLDWVGRLARHVSRRWEPDELAPPESESWESVGAEVSAFLASVVERHRKSQRRLSRGASSGAIDTLCALEHRPQS